MHTRSKFLLAAIAATAVLGLAASAASANRLSNSTSEKGVRIIWSSLTLEAGGRRIACPVTMEGTFTARTIVKRAGTQIAAINRAAKGTCTEGAATVLTETLPWTVQYSSYSGMLPSITSITQLLIGASFRASNGITCLARTETREPGRGISNVTSGEIRELIADSSAQIGVGGGFFCEFGTKAHFAGTASVSTDEGLNVRISLI